MKFQNPGIFTSPDGGVVNTVRAAVFELAEENGISPQAERDEVKRFRSTAVVLCSGGQGPDTTDGPGRSASSTIPERL